MRCLKSQANNLNQHNACSNSLFEQGCIPVHSSVPTSGIKTFFPLIIPLSINEDFLIDILWQGLFQGHVVKDADDIK